MLVHLEGWSKEGRLLGMGASNPTHSGDAWKEIDSKDHFDPGLRTSDKYKAGIILSCLDANHKKVICISVKQSITERLN